MFCIQTRLRDDIIILRCYYTAYDKRMSHNTQLLLCILLSREMNEQLNLQNTIIYFQNIFNAHGLQAQRRHEQEVSVYLA